MSGAPSLSVGDKDDGTILQKLLQLAACASPSSGGAAAAAAAEMSVARDRHLPLPFLQNAAHKRLASTGLMVPRFQNILVHTHSFDPSSGELTLRSRNGQQQCKIKLLLSSYQDVYFFAAPANKYIEFVSHTSPDDQYRAYLIKNDFVSLAGKLRKFKFPDQQRLNILTGSDSTQYYRAAWELNNPFRRMMDRADTQGDHFLSGPVALMITRLDIKFCDISISSDSIHVQLAGKDLLISIPSFKDKLASESDLSFDSSILFQMLETTWTEDELWSMRYACRFAEMIALHRVFNRSTDVSRWFGPGPYAFDVMDDGTITDAKGARLQCTMQYPLRWIQTMAIWQLGFYSKLASGSDSAAGSDEAESDSAISD